MQDELNGVTLLAKGIPLARRNFQMHLMPRTGAEQMLINKIDSLRFLIGNAPRFYYKDDIYVAVEDPSPVWPVDESDKVVKAVILEHDRVLELLRELPFQDR